MSILPLQVSADFAENPGLLSQHPVLAEFYFDSLHFIRVAQQWGDEYRCVYTRDTEPQSLLVVLNCLDPCETAGRATGSRLLGDRLLRHIVSARVDARAPGSGQSYRLPPSQLSIYQRPTGRLAGDRSGYPLPTPRDTLQRLASLLKEWLEAMPGNGIVYFPSYRYMHSCLRLLDDLEPRRTLWVQAPQECEERRAELLSLLQEKRDMVAFCILGGIFSEGIDLPGDALASVAVVGVGMPQVNQDTRELQEWYEQRTGAGFQYTFVYPWPAEGGPGAGTRGEKRPRQGECPADRHPLWSTPVPPASAAVVGLPPVAATATAMTFLASLFCPYSLSLPKIH